MTSNNVAGNFNFTKVKCLKQTFRYSNDHNANDSYGDHSTTISSYTTIVSNIRIHVGTISVLMVAITESHIKKCIAMTASSPSSLSNDHSTSWSQPKQQW